MKRVAALGMTLTLCHERAHDNITLWVAVRDTCAVTAAIGRCGDYSAFIRAASTRVE